MVLVADFGAGRDDRLRDIRHRLDDGLAEPGRIDADFAPSKQASAPRRATKCSKCRDRDGARHLVHRQKAHRDRVAARRRQFETARPGPIAQQAVRHLDHAAGAVADQRVGPDRAAVVEIDQDLQPAADDIVRFSAFDIRDKADAAGVVLVARIIKAFFASPMPSSMLFPPLASGLFPGRSPPSANAGRDPPFRQYA